MEELKQIKDILVEEVQSQMRNLHGVNAKELGEVIDMIKDLSETMYYCSIVKAMESGKESEYLQNDDRVLFRNYTPVTSGGKEGGLFHNSYEGRSP